MKSYIPNRVNHYKNFADAIDKKFMQVRYGVKSCFTEQDIDLVQIRKEIIDHQLNNDNDALTQVSIQYSTTLQVTYDNNMDDSDLTFLQHGGIGGITGPGCYARPQSLKINYDTSYGQGNIIDVNTAGCITRINLNPNINIDGGGTFVFTQSIAASTWNIIHNLGFIPNVSTKDINGITIQGVVHNINNNTIQIVFSSPVSGYAYLS